MKKDAPKTKLTPKQARRLENISYGLNRNNINIKALAKAAGLSYSVVYNWVNGWSLNRETDNKLTILEEAYAKVMHLNDSNEGIENASAIVPEATIMLDTSKLMSSMRELELNFAQVLALSKTHLPDDVVINEQNAEIPKSDMKKLEKLFSKSKGFFEFVEPEPVVEPRTETKESVPDISFQLIKCQEQLESIKTDVAEMKEKWLNLVKLFNGVEDSNAAIYALVKEIHYDLVGSYQEDATHNNATQAGI